MTPEARSALARAAALEEGFDLAGVAAADAPRELAFFAEWIQRGYAGEMAYLATQRERRSDLRTAFPWARSVLCVALQYDTPHPYSTEAPEDRGWLSRYAWGDDYHEVVGPRLEALTEWMRSVEPLPFDARVYVDTGPVQERAYARHAGIGWIGKNSCVINRELGSWIFLGVIVCSLPLDLDPPTLDQCGTCTLCLEACPTGALVAPGVLDSNRCISYITIEHRGDVDESLRPAIGSHVYGCDVCQEVCPWNAMAPTSEDAAWHPRPRWDLPSLLDLSASSDDELRASLRGSAMRRAKIGGLRRNIEIAINNIPA